MDDFIRSLRSYAADPNSFDAKKSLELEEKYNKWREEYAKHKLFLKILKAFGVPSDAGESTIPVPKAPSSPENKQNTKSIEGQKRAAAEYYRSQGYDVTTDDIVRHPGGSLSIRGFGTNTKRLPMNNLDTFSPQISETYKGAQ